MISSSDHRLHLAGSQPNDQQRHVQPGVRRIVFIAVLGVCTLAALSYDFLRLPYLSKPVLAATTGSQFNETISGEVSLPNLRSDYYRSDLMISMLPDAAVSVPAQNGCQRRCLDPHPGAFQAWNGQQNGCWIQVWRRWPEGCQHYQWFNSCNGYWDSYPNGAPKVVWTCCIH
ncbi:MAG TPA: hypothetical protein VGN86_10930 [Pyrinomonadaceae bacterium]|jgi:hypothetical protein|nr:hypothetical protein [Pyrinomonadaceae bacterium]